MVTWNYLYSPFHPDTFSFLSPYLLNVIFPYTHNSFSPYFHYWAYSKNIPLKVQISSDPQYMYLPAVFPIKVNSLNLEFLNQDKNIFPWFYQVLRSKFEADRFRSFWAMLGHLNIQTISDFYFVCIYKYCIMFFQQFVYSKCSRLHTKNNKLNWGILNITFLKI